MDEEHGYAGLEDGSARIGVAQGEALESAAEGVGDDYDQLAEGPRDHRLLEPMIQLGRGARIGTVRDRSVQAGVERSVLQDRRGAHRLAEDDEAALVGESGKAPVRHCLQVGLLVIAVARPAPAGAAVPARVEGDDAPALGPEELHIADHAYPAHSDSVMENRQPGLADGRGAR